MHIFGWVGPGALAVNEFVMANRPSGKSLEADCGGAGLMPTVFFYASGGATYCGKTSMLTERAADRSWLTMECYLEYSSGEPLWQLQPVHQRCR